MPGGQDEAAERVVLVDEHDRELGTEAKIRAHERGGVLHRAFSVFLFDAAGRTLLQKRAVGKYHFGGLWTNACCGHPRPGEGVADAGRRRLHEEMGIDAALEPVGTFVYRATDERTGLTEHELDHVLVGRFEGDPEPDPTEAEGWRWVTIDELERELHGSRASFTPWFAPAWREARRLIDRARGR